MGKRLLVGFLVVLLLTAAAIWRAPASLLDRWLQSNANDLDLNLTSGTVWNGHAESAIWRGLRLGELSWEVTRLRTDQLDLRFTSEGRQSAFSGALSLEGDDWITGNNLLGNMPANWLDISQFMPFVLLNGELDWELSQFRLPVSQPPLGAPSATGQIHWRGAALSGLAKATLGDIQMDLIPTESQLQIRISSAEAGQDVSVSGNLISDGGHYDADLLLAISSDRPDIARQLEAFGQWQADGRLRMQFNGALFPETNP